MHRQNSTTHTPLPQPDGDPRPAVTVHLGDFLRQTGRVAIASGKSGPAFSGDEVPVMAGQSPLVVDLARSLQVQALSVCGDLLSAIHRKCWPDIVAIWPRVISTLNLSVRHVPIDMQSVDYDRMAHVVIVAMGAAGDVTAEVKWQAVDTVLRSSAAKAQRDLLIRQETFLAHRAAELAVLLGAFARREGAR